MELGAGDDTLLLAAGAAFTGIARADTGHDTFVLGGDAEGSFAMAFLPDRRTIRVNLGQISGATVRAWWFDIATVSAVATGDFASTATPDFTAPGNNGFELVLDDAGRGFPRPGDAPAAQSVTPSLRPAPDATKPRLRGSERR